MCVHRCPVYCCVWLMSLLLLLLPQAKPREEAGLEPGLMRRIAVARDTWQEQGQGGGANAAGMCVMYVPACLPACPPACPPARLPACLPVCLCGGGQSLYDLA